MSVRVPDWWFGQSEEWQARQSICSVLGIDAGTEWAGVVEAVRALNARTLRAEAALDVACTCASGEFCPDGMHECGSCDERGVACWREWCLAQVDAKEQEALA